MPKLLLFDSDILVYRCGFSADSEAKKDWGVEKYMDMDYPEKALGNTKAAITGVFEKLEADPKDALFFLTGAGNFRDKIATIKPYKGNRDPTHKPKYYNEIRDYLVGVWKAQMVEGHEADDAMAMAQWACPDRSTCIVTIDKDLNMIPGWHYNWVKEEMFDESQEIKLCVELLSEGYVIHTYQSEKTFSKLLKLSDSYENRLKFFKPGSSPQGIKINLK